jgi:hypothetical protein
MIVVYREEYMKHVKVMYGQKAEFLSVKVGVTNNDHCAVKA